jgi:hypothetical protein
MLEVFPVQSQDRLVPTLQANFSSQDYSLFEEIGLKLKTSKICPHIDKKVNSLDCKSQNPEMHSLTNKGNVLLTSEVKEQ